MATYKVIGQPVARADGPAKVTGEAGFAVDVQLPGMLWAKVLRSPHPHARIVRVDTSKAAALPGVRAVLTGQDVRGHLQGRAVQDVPVLAWDVARFVGDKVAAVAADDEETAQRAVDLIEVMYEELPAVYNALKAMEADAPLVHADMLGYKGYARMAESPSNVFFRRSYGTGDPAVGFADAELIFDDTYETARTHPAFFEPRTCVVSADPDGRVEVWAANKAPHGLKQSLATAIGLPPERVLIHPAYVGGDFGSKAPPFNEPLCYFLSIATGRPVKMVMDYAEELQAGNPKHEAILRVKTGVKRDGTITAHHQELIFNSGAYAGLMPVGFLAGVDRIAGNFRIPHARFEMAQVYTHTVPGGYMRGPGEVQGTFAIESHMDEVARKLGMDPLDFRLKNILHEGDRTPMDELFTGIRAEETLRAAVEASNYTAPKPPPSGRSVVGRGIAMAARPGGAGETHVAVAFEPDGSVLVQTPLFEQGAGAYTLLRQVTAEVLGADPEQVRVEVWDTDAVPNDSGIAGSRTTRMMVPAVHDAAMQARDSLLTLAGELTGWPLEQLISESGAVRRTDTGAAMTWRELLDRVPGRVPRGQASSAQRGQPEVTAFTAQVAEVAVDPETGEVTVLRFTSAHDVGTIFNPVTHQGQINGGIIMGFGQALLEDFRVEDGRVTTLSFADFKIPNIGDVPPLQTVLVHSDTGTGPYNAKAIGEVPTLPVAPAIANAIRDATGIRMRSLPITAEKIYRALREQAVD
ncbi:MAG: xanthine dehydrogenase family protein molybdopterin-binding subunit [Dehalococcoidia bacterium]